MTITGTSDRVLNHPTHKKLEKKLASLYGWGDVISGSEEDQDILSAHLIRILWQATPMSFDKTEFKSILSKAYDMINIHYTKPKDQLNMIHKAMDSTVPEPEPVHNECDIIINTVCGETRTITMTQEITGVEYMGRTLNKDDDGEFSE